LFIESLHELQTRLHISHIKKQRSAEGFAKPGFLVKIEARGILKP